MKLFLNFRQSSKFLCKSVTCSFVVFMIGFVYFNQNLKEKIKWSIDDFMDRRYKEMTNKYFLSHNSTFNAINEQGVYSFWNVCIEYPGYFNEVSVDGTTYNETQRIVIYNSFYEDGQRTLSVSASGNAKIASWEVLFRQGSIPPTHTFHKATAFFNIPTCPSNLHHFWVDQFVALFNVVRRSNKLNQNAKNHLFYRLQTPDARHFVPGCHNASRYESILETLYLANHPKVFFQAPTNSCFSSAVFGSNLKKLGDRRVVINHTVDYFFKHS